ncbi:unnamed protein product [Schistosoma intercalatum]|nr:unnamed protein product [Schistosoma intercalatum]CAH8553498.1 unnamed protein product [Schistosoma intercalatum]
MKFGNQTKQFSHHVKVGPCFTRPAYRDGRRKTAVKVFTVADESCYLLIFGVPSLDLEHPLKEKCKQYGNVQSVVKIIDYPDKETFTDVFVVKYDNLKAARYAKRLLDDSSFYGGSLHVCYAPEYETVAECRLKLYECRHLNARISRKVEHDYLQKFSTKCQTSDPDSSVLPSPSVSSTSVKSDLSESIKLEIPTNRDITVLPVSQENTMHSNESATYQSYDALDDSRLYWRKLGITLFDKHQTACNFGTSCPTTAATINYPSIPTPCDLSVAPKRSIPLSVQQALSCRPYLENISKPNTSLSVSKVSSDTNKTVKHYPSISLIPRVIISKEYKRKHSTNSEALPQVSKSTAPISVPNKDQVYRQHMIKEKIILIEQGLYFIVQIPNDIVHILQNLQTIEYVILILSVTIFRYN